MLKFLLFFVIILSNKVIIFSQDTTDLQEFDKLRAKHLGTVAAAKFSSELTPSSAKKILGTKIKGEYRVEVHYDVDKGVEFFVKDTEAFYEMALSSSASYINMVLLPLLSNVGYKRLQQQFTIKKNSDSLFQISYKRGDTDTVYMMKIGNLGLVDKILFLENNKKMFAAEILWTPLQGKYVPQRFKVINYESTTSSQNFDMYKIILK